MTSATNTPTPATLAPAGPALSLTTPEERRQWHLRWWWRKVRLLGACPPRRTLASMMVRNSEACGR